MLDKISKTVLDTLIRLGYTRPNADFKSIKANLLPFLPKIRNHEWTFENVQSCLVYLKKFDYVDYSTFSIGYYPVPDCTMVYTTHKGANYKKFTWIQIKEFLITSIFVPIGVSFSTTLITLIINHFLS